MLVSKKVKFSRQHYVFLEWIKSLEKKTYKKIFPDFMAIQAFCRILIQAGSVESRPLVPYFTIIQHILTTVTTAVRAGHLQNVNVSGYERGALSRFNHYAITSEVGLWQTDWTDWKIKEDE